jgi:hypothetical protein
MVEMDAHFSEMIDTLVEARQVVEGELSSLSQASGLDRRSLVVLDHSVRDFAAQADALVLMMAERGAPAEINGDAKELQGFFQLARERIASFLTVGRE